ncbi:MAG TPA: chemotaxis protein CheB [Bryobacteraceae bacterium]|nr:chemotaxis protein CheB [Bryobacteraceae bacterium]
MAEKKRSTTRKARPPNGGPRTAKSAIATPASPATFPIVGIGASAGGLEALSAFLKALPARTGMAVVIIQHLAPQHESALTQLLSKASALPVSEVSQGMAVQPNHVYVIPPDKTMTIRDTALHLIPRLRAAVPHHPIDEFLTSLARDHKTAAIGVILSGSGSDGTLGLKAIKEEGGLTFAQDPKTAAWPDMSASAISSGAVDFVLAPAAIAGELTRIGRHPYLLDHAEPPEGDDLEKIYALLRSATGVDFRLYKQPTVSRRVARRMALQKMHSLSEYVRFLKRNAPEIKALADDIFIHVTSFFRDPECFQALRKQVFPLLNLNRRPAPVRVWVPGCSTGEEVYSIAMHLLESLGANTRQTKIQMFGTDISEPAIERARAGLYSEAAVRGVSPARLRRFFIKLEHGYQINKEVRGLCVFARHDLASDPPFSKLDLISCRNVLIYAGPNLQSRILYAFQYALQPGGFLFLGKSEAISAYSAIFAPLDRAHKIFARKPTAALAQRFDWRLDDHREPGPPSPIAPLPALPLDFRKQAENVLLQRYAPPALVIDSDLRILHIQGNISPYLALPTGPPTAHLLKMLRPEFVLDLRKTASKAQREGTTAATQLIHFEHGGQSSAVRIEVSPLSQTGGAKPDLLVVFNAVAAPPPSGSKADLKSRTKKDATLERELAATREYLSSLIAEHETAQEQMKAAHEEILSSSEELQSANEELETAKEELQSSNEELLTLNEELLHRNLDLSVLTNDLNNVLAGVEIPVVVLDGSLRIRRFTPAAGRLLNLIETDAGRPFSDISSAQNISDWDQLFAEVTSQGHPIEREVKDKRGRWLSLRIRPYRTTENKIDGVIVVLFDSDMIKRELEEFRDYAHMLLESAEQAIVAANAGGKIVLVNGATEKMFGYPRADLLGEPLDLLLTAGREGRRSDGTRFPLEISISSIDQAGVNLTVAFMTDITERRRLEALSETYRAEIRALAAQLMTAQEEERRRVSRELHDSLCQKLASLALDVENLAVALPPPPATRTRLQELGARAIQVSEEARHIAYELHPSVLDDLGLVISLQALCDEFAKAEKIRVDFKVGKLPDQIPQKIASGLYRIAQEGLQNIAKHARAKRLSVGLVIRDHRLVLSLEDDGIGFAPDAVKGKGGLGLVSIGERARILGGTLSIESKPGYGTRISVSVSFP